MSWVLLGIQLVVAGVHLVPRLVYLPNPRTARVIEFINTTLGPWWVVLFGLSTVALFLTLQRKRFRHFGHLSCVFVWVAYTVALWFGALTSRPVGPVLFASVATGLVFVHLVVATAYADDPREGRHHAG
jgi:4-hydroxybenzoate polyprenyltransferase